ncbi:hypothetical protein ACIRO1_45435 [Streptomyces sp. NPDC102381]|uniref:hypothetical protein n=1 Tax=Streptomyces sp. NPDC102381 TaxID=3366164 RepID=UPI0038115D89
MTLRQTSKLYEYARTADIWDTPVEFAPALRFLSAATHLLRALGDLADHELWQEPTARLRSCRRVICTVPLPFNSVPLQLADQAAWLEDWAQRQRPVLQPEHVRPLGEAVESLKALSAEGANPLASAAEDFLTLDGPAGGLMAVPSRKFLSVISNSLPPTSGIQAGVYSNLQAGNSYTSAALVGPPSWIPPSLLTAPRAAQLAVVHYQFFRTEPSVDPLFDSVFGDAALSMGVHRDIERSRPYTVASTRPAPQAETVAEHTPSLRTANTMTAVAGG